MAALLTKLRDAQVSFNLLHHQPVLTSEDAARVRGTDLNTGAKALLLKCKGKKDTESFFVLVVMSAARKLDSKK